MNNNTPNLPVILVALAVVGAVGWFFVTDGPSPQDGVQQPSADRADGGAGRVRPPAQGSARRTGAQPVADDSDQETGGDVSETTGRTASGDDEQKAEAVFRSLTGTEGAGPLRLEDSDWPEFVTAVREASTAIREARVAHMKTASSVLRQQIDAGLAQVRRENESKEPDYPGQHVLTTARAVDGVTTRYMVKVAPGQFPDLDNARLSLEGARAEMMVQLSRFLHAR